MRKAGWALLLAAAMAPAHAAPGSPPRKAPVPVKEQTWLAARLGGFSGQGIGGVGFQADLNHASGRRVYGLQYARLDDSDNDVPDTANCFPNTPGTPGAGVCTKLYTPTLEQWSVLLGRRLSRRWWAATGVSHLRRREQTRKDREYTALGVPLELWFAHESSIGFGFEARLSGQVNGEEPYAMLSIGFRLGDLR